MTKETKAERDAFAAVKQFKAAFDAADAAAIAATFAPDAVFLGTSMPGPERGRAKVLKYFQPAMSINLPKGIRIDSRQSLRLSDVAVLFSGRCTYWHTREGKKETAKARYTLLLVKGKRGWAIAHFHSSMAPAPR